MFTVSTLPTPDSVVLVLDASNCQASQVGAALAPNTGAIMAFRLIGGMTSSAAHPIAPYALFLPNKHLDADDDDEGRQSEKCLYSPYSFQVPGLTC